MGFLARLKYFSSLFSTHNNIGQEDSDCETGHLDVLKPRTANDLSLSEESDEMELIKVTLSYCPHEDRVRMDGLGSTAKTIRMWFPGRLLSLLVQHLGQQSALLAQPSQTYQPDGLRADNRMEDTLVLEPESPAMLVWAVDVKILGGNRVELIYKDSEGRKSARHCMTLHSLEKWMGGLKRCFETAQWSLEPFFKSKISLEVEGPLELTTIH